MKEFEKFQNPDPLYRLIGEANESEVKVEGVNFKALIDSGGQVSSILEPMTKLLGLEIQNLQTLLGLEGAHGGQVPYMGYTEIHLEILEVSKFKQDVLMLVVPSMNYNQMVPITIRTLHIDMIHELATKEELGTLSKQWRRGLVNRRVISQQMQLDTGITKHIEGEVKLGRNNTLGPMETLKTKGITRFSTHGKRINVLIDPLDESLQSDILVVPSYDYLKQGSKKIRIALQNNCREVVKLKKGMIVAKFMSANMVPSELAPKINDEKDGLEPLTQKLTKLFDKLDLWGISEWSQKNQDDVHKLEEENWHLFALNDLELGKTSLVKHHIKLDNPQPFKERYRRILPHQYDKVKKHIEEMLKIRAIRRSVSPWASTVVLVWQKWIFMILYWFAEIELPHY